MKPVALLRTITTTQPMEIVSVDFFPFDRCSGGYEYLASGHRSLNRRYSHNLQKTKHQKETAAERILNDFILRFNMSRHILQD